MNLIYQDVENKYELCPYCGGEMLLIEDGGKYSTACEGVYANDLTSQIIDCKVETEWVDTEQEAIENWQKLDKKDYEVL